MTFDKEKLREMVLKKAAENADEIVGKLTRLMANPNPRTMLEAEKGLHAQTTRIADDIFKEVVQELLQDQDLKQAAVEERKKGASPSSNNDSKPPSS
jgi:hypothetical protein